MSLLTNGIITFVSSFSGTFLTFASLRFVNGFMIGAPGTLTFSYVGEFYSDKYRPKAITAMGLFWLTSWILLPVFAWIIIPLKLNYQIFGISCHSWRLFVLVFALPSILTALLLMRYPESPKFLLSQGKKKEALAIIRQIFAANTGKDKHEFPISNLIMDSDASENQAKTISDIISNIRKQVCYLMTPPLLKYTALTSLTMAVTMFGYLGFAFWFPELFNRFESHYRNNPNASVTLCELSALRNEIGPVYLNDLNTTETNFTNVGTKILSTLTSRSLPILEKSSLQTCDPSVDLKVFSNTIIIGAVSLVVNVAAIYLSHHLSNNILQSTTLTIASIFCCTLYFVRSTFQNLIVASLFSAFANVGIVVFTGAVVDLFPTRVNAMAVCTATFTGRCGAILSNILFGELLDTQCALLVFLMSAALLCAGLLGFLVPKKIPELPQSGKKSSTA
ncbi:synaptic vesicle glycoprotein 2B isoform X2 [Cephus cinctus]|nr:synaptic vesicle glycoprotein 2B isoform X2 [Cephus cinctus]